MNWFKKKYTVCATCRVHFEPYTDDQDYFNLCPAHREEPLKLQHRINIVMKWARYNWAKLESQIFEGGLKKEAEFHRDAQSAHNEMAASHSSQHE